VKKKFENILAQFHFTFVGLFVFFSVIIISFLYGLYLTFTNWDGISDEINIVGFKNYIEVFKDENFWYSIQLTILYVFIGTIIVNLIAFIIAYILTSEIKGQNLFRTGFFTPNLIGGILLGMLWNVIFQQILTRAGEVYNIEFLKTSLLSGEKTAFFALVIGYIWQYTGYFMIIYIAGFMNIPKDLIEAASIDGASLFYRIRKIIVPFMVPSFIICIFLSIQRGFMVYDVNKALTDGGPYGSTKLASYHVFEKAFLLRDYGGGQAEAFILFFIVVIITLVQTLLMKRMEVEA
jgi:raffinose/stachyose/melibiose transport system permease protein